MTAHKKSKKKKNSFALTKNSQVVLTAHALFQVWVWNVHTGHNSNVLLHAVAAEQPSTFSWASLAVSSWKTWMMWSE